MKLPSRLVISDRQQIPAPVLSTLKWDPLCKKSLEHYSTSGSRRKVMLARMLVLAAVRVAITERESRGGGYNCAALREGVRRETRPPRRCDGAERRDLRHRQIAIEQRQ